MWGYEIDEPAKNIWEKEEGCVCSVLYVKVMKVADVPIHQWK